MYKIELMSKEDILCKKSLISSTIHKASSKVGWDGSVLVESALLNPTNNHIWEGTDKDGNLTGYVTTRILHTSTHSTLDISNMAIIDGTTFDWNKSFEAMTHLEEVAKHIGLDRISITGRTGWKKLIKPLGYNTEVVVYSKNLKEK